MSVVPVRYDEGLNRVLVTMIEERQQIQEVFKKGNR